MHEINFKKPPHSADFELAILGCLMIHDLSIETVRPILSESDFYMGFHQDVYRAILILNRQGKPNDLVSVSAYLETQNRENQQEERQYLVDVVKNTPGSANVEYYAKGIKEKAVLRTLIRTSNDISEQCYLSQKEAKDIIDDAEARIHDLNRFSTEMESAFSTAQDVAVKAIEKLDELFNSDSHLTGLSTGFDEVDLVTAGLQPGDFIIVAGRPSMGKTSFAMNIAEKVGIYDKNYASVFSLEMPEAQLMNRVFSSVGKIPSERIRTGKLLAQDWPKLNKAVSLVQSSNLMFNDQAGLSVMQLKNFARKMDREARKRQTERNEEIRGLDLIVVDYIQLMSAEKENRTQEVSEISRGLKNLAKELKVPLIALSQLNRSLETRPNKRPVMSDLRESGAIEQDADLIFFVYRDEVYNRDSEDKGMAEIILAKHRNGPLDVFRLEFQGEYTLFKDKDFSDIPKRY